MHEAIGVLFDFDDTLAPDSTSAFLESQGVNVPDFWKNEVGPLIEDGWDLAPAYMYALIERERTQKLTINQDILRRFGKQVTLYPGATQIFSRVQKHAKSANQHVAVEFYLISSGIGDIIRNTRIAKHFKEIWTCEFLFDYEGRAKFPRNVISFSDKTRFIFRVSKGIVGVEYKGKPFEVNRKIPEENLRIPLNQMIFVGDGFTDVPCFSVIKRYGGIAIGVYDGESREKWGRAWGFIEDQRVSNLNSADYRKGSDLYNSLLMAVESMAKKIKLRRDTYQG